MLALKTVRMRLMLGSAVPSSLLTTSMTITPGTCQQIHVGKAASSSAR